MAAGPVSGSICLWFGALGTRRQTRTPTGEAVPRVVPGIACGAAPEVAVRAIRRGAYRRTPSVAWRGIRRGVGRGAWSVARAVARERAGQVARAVVYWNAETVALQVAVRIAPTGVR